LELGGEPFTLTSLPVGSRPQKALGQPRADHPLPLLVHVAHLLFLDEQIEQFNREIAARIQAPLPPAAPPNEAATEPPPRPQNPR
jgi:hypothetical protein